MKKFTLLIAIGMLKLAVAQETVGLIYDDINQSKSEGYTLFNPTSDSRVFIMNNCGEVLNQWTFTGTNSRNAYFLENGTLLQSSEMAADIRDWDNNVIWSVNYQTQFGFSIHHDIEPLPNGNFLALVRDVYTNTEMFDVGMDTSYPNETLVLERIVEIEPVGSNSANIVWEWKLFDHLVQEFDNTKPNFGVVANNPELLDMNYDGGFGSNFIHANAIDYNDNLDQIIMSSRHLSEVFIIDHSTTTSQAAGHSGGIYGKGGDFLWRWGNPEVYDQGTSADKKIGKQHDIKWIVDGVNQGKLSVFSNDGYGSNLAASSIHIIDQNDTNGVYSMSSGKFLPEDYFWSWDGIIMNDVMHAAAQSGVQILSNGNALINESDIGRISEVNSNGQLIWVYRIPAGGGSNFNQFTQPVGNGAFRANRYSENYSGFNGVTFNNTGIIENQNSISANCVNSLSVDDVLLDRLSVYPNPTKGILNFRSDAQLDQIEVYNITGKLVLRESNSNNINMERLVSGIYMVKISIDNNSEFIKVIKQ